MAMLANEPENILTTSEVPSEESTEAVDTSRNSEESPQGIPVFPILVSLLAVVGIVGNGLVLGVLLSRRKMRMQITGTLVINQSLVDMTCSLFLIITYSYQTKPVLSYSGYGREAICFLIVDEMLMYNAMNASTYSLLVITMERYMMIVLPIMHRNSFTRRTAIVMCVIAWAAGYLWNTPASIYSTSVKDGECFPLVWKDLQAQVIFGIIYVAATFFVPMLFFATAYAHMGWVLRRRHAQLGTETTSNTSNTQSSNTKLTRAQVNLTKTMVMVTAAFAICWTPNQIYYLLFNLGYNLDFTSPGYMLTLFMSFLNSCINPFIYAYKLESFKEGLKRLGCFKKKGQEELSGPSGPGTVGTQDV